VAGTSQSAAYLKPSDVGAGSLWLTAAAASVHREPLRI